MFTASNNRPTPGATNVPKPAPEVTKLPNATAASSKPKVVRLRASLRLDVLPVNSPATKSASRQAALSLIEVKAACPKASSYIFRARQQPIKA